MLKINIKSALIGSILLMATFLSGQQLSVEHFSFGNDPTVKLIDTGINNFTRLFFCNTNTDKEWRISSRTLNSGLDDNRMDFNYYNGSSTNTFLSFNGDDTKIVASENTEIGGNLYINKVIGATTTTQVKIFSDTESFGLDVENDFESPSVTWGAKITADGNGPGNRIGVFGDGDCEDGNATGVHGFANSDDGNEYGIYGEADGPTGESWSIYGNGDIYYTGSFTAPSDRKLKKNIQTLSTATLANLMLLEAKTYEYDQDLYPSMNFAKGPQIGFLAQDMQALFPETVVEQTHYVFDTPGDLSSNSTKVEMLGVDYIKMIPVLTSAIQEQTRIIESIQADNDALRAELDEIKVMLTDLKK